MSDWEYNHYNHMWLMGTESNGCGVIEDYGIFYANIVKDDLVLQLGPFASLEEAQEEAEAEFAKV